MDEPGASTSGVPSPAPMEHPCSLEIDVVGGGRGEEEQQIHKSRFGSYSRCYRANCC